jgi:hypothetical protein
LYPWVPDHKAAGPSTRKLLTGHLPQAVSGSRDLSGEGKKIVEVPNYEVPYVCHTLFTSYTKGGDMDGAWKEIQEGDCYSYREGRPALIVSSTSWCNFLITQISCQLVSPHNARQLSTKVSNFFVVRVGVNQDSYSFVHIVLHALAVYTDIRVYEGEFQSTPGCQRAASFEFGVYLVQRQVLRFSPYPSSDLRQECKWNVQDGR